jgi:hypothetical protein
VAIVSLSMIVAHERLTNGQLAANNRALAVATLAANRSRDRAEERENMALKAIDSYRNAVESNPDLLTRSDLKPLRRACWTRPWASIANSRRPSFARNARPPRRPRSTTRRSPWSSPAPA